MAETSHEHGDGHEKGHEKRHAIGPFRFDDHEWHYIKIWAWLCGLLAVSLTPFFLYEGFGMVVAFVPSRQIDSVWVFEAKIVAGLVICLGVAALLYRRGARGSAAAP